jgi:hypothetical protein
MLVPIERIERSILLLRGRKVLIDADLAELYGVTTKRLNEQVRRNLERFPDDFMFRLNAAEKSEVVAKCDHLARLKFSPSLPNAFSEHGAIMVASVLNSPQAIKVSVYVVRAFVRLREIAANNHAVMTKIDEIARRVAEHDQALARLFEAIRQLMAPPPGRSRQIGFDAEKL